MQEVWILKAIKKGAWHGLASNFKVAYIDSVRHNLIPVDLLCFGSCKSVVG